MLTPLHVFKNKILNYFGEQIDLRGVNKYGFESHPGGGWWNGVYYHTWNEPNWIENVSAELDIIKSWGIKTIRFHDAVEHWKLDVGGHRNTIKELLNIMKSKNMYMILDFYSVNSIAPDPLPPAFGEGKQDPLPYPPYQKGINAAKIITNEQEFIDLWTTVSYELKGYPNIIFELWNEPNRWTYDESMAFNSWASVCQRCVDAIRSVGAKQLIILHWGFNLWVTLNNPPPVGAALTMDWAWQMGVKDPFNNLVYSVHIYRKWGSFHYWNGEQIQAWTPADIDMAFKYMKLDQAVKIFPIIIGEIGCNIDALDLENELAAYKYCLSIFNSWGIPYLAWVWTNFTDFRLYDFNYIPNLAGGILIEAFKIPISQFDEIIWMILFSSLLIIAITVTTNEFKQLK